MAKKTSNYQKLKDPYQPWSGTHEQFQEFKRCAQDPLYFMENYMWIIGQNGRELFKAFDFQKNLIKTYHDNLYSIAMLPRQSGKTTSAAGYLLWYATFNENATILVASNKAKSAGEIMTRIKYAYEELPDHIRAGVTEYNVQSIKFDNGSRIMSETTTVSTGRGFAVNLLYCLDGESVVSVRNKHTGEIENISLIELKNRLDQ
jgi:hypothetical protein